MAFSIAIITADARKGLVNGLSFGGHSNATENKEDDMDSEDIRNFYISIDDTRYQWTQSKTKNQQALMSTRGLTINNKLENTIFASTVELPLVVESDDFTFGIVTKPVKLSEDTGLALLFDYQDDRNFKTIIIDDSQYRYMVYSGGIPSTVKTGLIKFPKKAKTISMYIQREGSIIHFFLNDVEYGTFKNVSINNPTFGAGVLGKNYANIIAMIFKLESNDGDSEQSTTGN